MVKLVNRAKMTTATTGTGTLTLGAAVDGFQTFAAAGVADADVVRYVIEDGTAWEIGTGTYGSVGGTLTRTPSESSIGGGAITLSGDAVVFVSAASDDLQELVDFANTFTLPTTDGTNGQVLTTDGSGGLTFKDAGGGGGGTMAAQDSDNVSITGGTINGTTIGATTPSSGAFSTLSSSQDALLNGQTVGRGAGSISTNTAVGGGALSSNTTGGFNTANGTFALQNNTTGIFNAATGTFALQNNTTGNINTATGPSALVQNTTGSFNTATGLSALSSNTTGSFNTATGHSALSSNTTGNNNIGIGDNAGQSNSPFTVTTQANRIIMGNNNHTDAYIRIAWTVTSDARDKTELNPIPHGLDFVNALQPTEYQFKIGGRDGEADGRRRYGFLAQDVLGLEGDNPVIADDEDPENLKLHESYIVPVLVNAVKELTAQVRALQSEVKELKGE